MCEYAHAMGSAFGSGCADFERAFRLLEFRRCFLATFGPVSKLPFDHFPICLFSSRSQTRPKHKPVHRWFILALEYLVGCTAPFCIQIHFFSNYFLMQCVLSLIRDFASRCRCRFLAFLLRIFPCTAACNGITTTVISAWNFRFSQTLLRIVFKKSDGRIQRALRCVTCGRGCGFWSVPLG